MASSKLNVRTESARECASAVIAINDVRELRRSEMKASQPNPNIALPALYQTYGSKMLSDCFKADCRISVLMTPPEHTQMCC